MWDVLDQLERTRRKKKKRRSCRKSAKGIVKCLLYWMCIKFFRSRTTDIYSLRYQVLADYGKHITWLKIKDLTKCYNRITRILVEFGLPSFFLTSSATLYRPITRMSGSTSSWNIPLVHQTRSVGRFQSCISFGFFQISNISFIKSPSLTRVKK